MRSSRIAMTTQAMQAGRKRKGSGAGQRSGGRGGGPRSDGGGRHGRSDRRGGGRRESAGLGRGAGSDRSGGGCKQGGGRRGGRVAPAPPPAGLHALEGVAAIEAASLPSATAGESRSSTAVRTVAVVVNGEECVACGACTSVCVRGALNVTDTVHVDASACDGCGECVFTCARDVLALHEV